jgi:hypothetical protein
MSSVNKIYFLIIFLLLTGLFSCKKDTDGKAPLITINNPILNQSFNVFDYITVNASVSDETQLTSISVSLMDVNDNYAHVSLPVTVTSSSMTFNLQYLLDNIHLETGIYYIKITASDGENDSNVFQKIYLIALPKQLKKLFVISKTGSTHTILSNIDSAFSSMIPYHSFNGDYLSSSLSSYYQQAYICGNFTGNFTGYTLLYNTPKFTVAPVISSNPYFTGYYHTDKHSYVCLYNGNINGYDYAGSIVYSANAIAGYYAQSICLNDGFLIAEEKEILSMSKKLVTYYATGSQEKNCPLSQDVIQFCEKNNSNVFVFGNISGQATIQLFDRINNNLWSPYPFSLAAGSLLSVLQLDSDNYLLGHSNGTIYKYQYSLNSVTAFLNGYTAVKMKFDNINNRLYVVEANRISSLDYPSLSLENSIISSEIILDLHLLYNR